MNRYPMLSRFLLFALLCTVIFLSGNAVAAVANTEWPRTFSDQGMTVTVYQPQPESLEGNLLKGRAAISVIPKGEKEPVFGAVWLESKVAIDRDQRTVQVLSTNVPRVRFADATPDQQAYFSRFLENELNAAHLSMNYDQLLASLSVAQKERREAEELNMTPPKIIFETVPAILVLIDGEPRLRDVEGTKLKRIVNTPFFIVLDTSTGTYWLNGGSRWFVAREIKGNWQQNPTPPKEVAGALAAELDTVKAKITKPETSGDQRVPKIIVATEPTELIVFDGEPKFTPLTGSDLLYVINTEDDVFMDMTGQQYYVVLAGRWYRSGSLRGPWEFVRPDHLPQAFARIPESSEKGKVLPFVAGSRQAQEAFMDAQIPQTAAIKRNEASLNVVYDGEPRFEPVPKTTIEQAVNTQETVLRIGDRYYCCHQAVWYVADSPEGPWVVADYVPPEVQTIPPESPAYNVKYVRVYDATPDVVYVGYTPSYLGCYPYYGTVVYGTGYYYPPYFGPLYYYPRPFTWGFHVNFNPWTGWSYGMSWSAGWLDFSLGFGYYGGWWGPGGYLWRPNHNYFYRPVNIYRPVGTNVGIRGTGTRSFSGNRPLRNVTSLYSRGDNARILAGSGAWNRVGRQTAAPRVSTRGQVNNVFTDREGNVMRRGKDGSWQRREQGTWKPADRKTGATGAVPPAMNRGGGGTLDRDYEGRRRGIERAQSYRPPQSYQRSQGYRSQQGYQRPAGGYSRPSGGAVAPSRGGGGYSRPSGGGSSRGGGYVPLPGGGGRSR
ncbi:hypothetical protein [Geobacter sp. AOG1]|uniref:hypothetical protein n=1 Tax=Geobacter sp. AOG1 TaxID=1566346 RepID=UPI001CC57EBE|nr:hypothetical protein [Geobacter sp. AOG1]GFE58788.1 hypothetical protein AOG1_26680 [Geobacter sp. AOG1]